MRLRGGSSTRLPWKPERGNSAVSLVFSWLPALASHPSECVHSDLLAFCSKSVSLLVQSFFCIFSWFFWNFWWTTFKVVRKFPRNKTRNVSASMKTCKDCFVKKKLVYKLTSIGGLNPFLTCHSLQSACPAKRNRVTELYSCQNCGGGGERTHSLSQHRSTVKVKAHFSAKIVSTTFWNKQKTADAGVKPPCVHVLAQWSRRKR